MDWRILYNPLAVIGKGKDLAAAFVVIAVLTAVAWWGGVHLDGALDIHITPERPVAWVVITESLIDWFALALMFLAGARMLGGDGGLTGYLAASGLGRFPFIFATFIFSRQVLGGTLLRAVVVTPEGVVVQPGYLTTPAFIIGSTIALAMVAWAITMLVFGFKEISRLQGGKLAAGFVIGLILAEIVSKLAIWAILTLV